MEIPVKNHCSKRDTNTKGMKTIGNASNAFPATNATTTEVIFYKSPKVAVL